MKILSVRAPWSWLIFHGKDIENRTRRTNIRGRIGIHASATLSLEEWRSAIVLMDLAKRRGFEMPELPYLKVSASVDVTVHSRSVVTERILETPKEITLGAIIGTVEIVDCVESNKSPWFGGPFGYVLRDPQLLTQPIPAKGSLGFWERDIPLGVAA